MPSLERTLAESLPAPSQALLLELARVTQASPSDVLRTALARYGSLLLGDPDPDHPAADADPGPFRKYGSERPAAVRLQQRGAKDFYLLEPFRYLKPGQPTRVVPWKEPLNPHADVTDLASVPDFLTWLVPRYGRHSLPALLHDDLQSKVRSGDISSRSADVIFRDAMGDTRVPFVRRWLMWAAVSTRTRWKAGLGWKVFIVAWVVLYGAGFGIAGPLLLLIGVPWQAVIAGIAAALVSPLLLSVLWLWERRAGFLLGYGLVVITVPLLFVGLATLAYLGVESLAKLWDKDRPVRTSRLGPMPAARR